MKKLTTLCFVILVSLGFVQAQTQTSIPDTLQILALVEKLGSDHPRIMIGKSDIAEIKSGIGGSAIKTRIHQDILKECEMILTLPQLERIQTGRRLLGVSRESLRRVFYLSYAYRSSGDVRFLKRAEQEIVTVSSFSDWNPSHFLDVGEMTMAVAIGYDWLFDDLSEQTRKLAREAIISKGIEPSFDKSYNWFVNTTNNWNQVCHAGMIFGALAIAETDSRLSASVIQRAIAFVPTSMQFYAPDGAYPEGYMYWDYGTSFNVLLIDALEKAFGSDFGLSQTQGFLESAAYLQHMIGPTMMVHNWGDSWLDAILTPAVFWFAQKTNDTSLLWFQRKIALDEKRTFVSDRLLPALLLWSKSVDVDKVVAPSENVWIGQGKSPVGLMRTSWTDPDATFVGLKAGSASVSHAHMDAGSFVIDAIGERWAMDFGMQNYHTLESKGVNLWSMNQTSDRWKVFRYNNFVHNTLTIDNQLHDVKGYAKIERSSKTPSNMFFTTDLSNIFLSGVKKATRGIKIENGKDVVIRDEITSTTKGTSLRWSFLTAAKPRIVSKELIELTLNGKKMYLHFSGNTGFKLSTWSTKPTNDYDADNGDTIVVGFEAILTGDVPNHFEVVLSEKQELKRTQKAIAQW